MNSKNIDYIPNEILELLPWFTTNKLSADDQIIFEDALKTYPSLQQEVDDERQFIENVSANKSVLDKRIIAAPEERLKAVFNTIDNPVVVQNKECNIKSETLRSFFESVKASLNSFTSSQSNGSQNGAQFATFAGIGALVLSVAVITAVVIPDTSEQSEFTLASAGTPNAIEQASSSEPKDIKLLVGFNGSSEELSNMDVFKGMQIQIESPDDKEGFFEVSFKESLDSEEITETVDGLLAHEEKIWFAGEAF